MSTNNPGMSPTPDREEALFQAAAFLNGPDRAAYLDRACIGDEPLRKRLEALLAAHEGTDSVLAEPEHAPAQARSTIALQFPAEDEVIGTMIGRYKLREKLGE